MKEIQTLVLAPSRARRLAPFLAPAVAFGLMAGAAMAQTDPSPIDTTVTGIVDTIKASLNTTVGKAMTIGVILLLAAVSWRAIKRLTS